MHWVQFKPNVNEETAKYTELSLRGEVYLAVSELLLRKSQWRCPPSRIQPNVSMLIPSSNFSQVMKARELKFWEKVHLPPPVMCQVSRVTFHVSLFTCHFSRVTCHMSNVRFFHTKWSVNQTDKNVALVWKVFKIVWAPCIQWFLLWRWVWSHVHVPNSYPGRYGLRWPPWDWRRL